MRRTLYDPEHEDVRALVREFVDRHVRPRHEEFITAKAFPRDLWIEAGKQGLLGLQMPEEYGGGGVVEDYRFTAAAAEELSAFSGAQASCFGIHADGVPPYKVDHGTPEPLRVPGIAFLHRREVTTKQRLYRAENVTAAATHAQHEDVHTGAPVLGPGLNWNGMTTHAPSARSGRRSNGYVLRRSAIRSTSYSTLRRWSSRFG